MSTFTKNVMLLGLSVASVDGLQAAMTTRPLRSPSFDTSFGLFVKTFPEQHSDFQKTHLRKAVDNFNAKIKKYLRSGTLSNVDELRILRELKTVRQNITTHTGNIDSAYLTQVNICTH